MVVSLGVVVGGKFCKYSDEEVRCAYNELVQLVGLETADKWREDGE